MNPQAQEHATTVRINKELVQKAIQVFNATGNFDTLKDSLTQVRDKIRSLPWSGDEDFQDALELNENILRAIDQGENTNWLENALDRLVVRLSDIEMDLS